MLTLAEREERTQSDINDVRNCRNQPSWPLGIVGKRIRVLDEGYVQLRGYLGDDVLIEEAARQSYGASRKVSETTQLLRYLYRHGHSTPFEMGELIFIIRCPIDTSRQLVRHRAASMCEEGSMFSEPSINEYSTRYSVAIDHTATTSPEAWRTQSNSNKQGSGGMLTSWPDCRSLMPDQNQAEITPGAYLTMRELELHKHARDVYEERLRLGVAREQARKDLPLSTYTQFYMKCDLRNLLHFFSLRMDHHAQYEIRQYAKAMAVFAEVLFPITWQAFLDYDFRQGGLVLSSQDIEVIKQLMKSRGNTTKKADFDEAVNSVGWPADGKHRERDECYGKLLRMGIVND